MEPRLRSELCFSTFDRIFVGARIVRGRHKLLETDGLGGLSFLEYFCKAFKDSDVESIRAEYFCDIFVGSSGAKRRSTLTSFLVRPFAICFLNDNRYNSTFRNYQYPVAFANQSSYNAGRYETTINSTLIVISIHGFGNVFHFRSDWSRFFARQIESNTKRYGISDRCDLAKVR